MNSPPTITSVTPPESQTVISDNTEAMYTIFVRGERFQLSHSQITFDSPNYFTTCFFKSGFAEAIARVLRLDRHPVIFTIVVDYLSGYPILPLSSCAIPHMMDMSTARRFLKEDAEYYGLEGLCRLLESSSQPRPDLGWAGFTNQFVNLRDVLADELPDGVVKKEDGSVISTRTGLPVLVYARDLTLRIVISHYNYESPSGRSRNPWYTSPKPSFHVELQYAPHEGKYTPTGPCPLNANSTDSLNIRINNVGSSGHMHIDNVQYALDNLLELRDPEYSSNGTLRFGNNLMHTFEWATAHGTMTDHDVYDSHEYRYEVERLHRAYVFVADEVLLYFPPRAESDPDATDTSTGTLLRARMRTINHYLNSVVLPTPD